MTTMTTMMSKSADTLYRPRTAAAKRRYLDIQARYKELYEVERKRMDDCIAVIMQEFYLDSEQTVWRILRTPVDDAPSEEATSK